MRYHNQERYLPGGDDSSCYRNVFYYTSYMYSSHLRSIFMVPRMVTRGNLGKGLHIQRLYDMMTHSMLLT